MICVKTKIMRHSIPKLPKFANAVNVVVDLIHDLRQTPSNFNQTVDKISDKASCGIT